MCTFGISRQPRGAALVIVMLVMAVLLLAGTTFMTISANRMWGTPSGCPRLIRSPIVAAPLVGAGGYA